VNDIAAAEGMSKMVTHLAYTHHHCDHAGASSLFGSMDVHPVSRP
jgi:glyoxylase-like metal-dependent hydrolase (beta-lactamase superfamily II)